MSEEQVQEQPVAEESQAPEAPVPEAAQPPAPESSEGFQSPYEAFRALPDFAGQDDITIARNLYGAYNGFNESQRQLQQYQQVVPYAQEYLRNKNDFEKWQQSQAAEAAKAAEPEPPPKWWNPPQVKDQWKSYIVRDPQTGKEVIDPNAPFEAQQALRDYQAYTSDFARRFVTDPENVLQPFVEQIATQKAQEMVQQQLGQFQAKSYIQNLEEQNADWLFDANGQVTPEGQAVQRHIEGARQLGIQSPQERWAYATGMLQRDLLEHRFRQGQQQPMQAPPEQAMEQAPQQPPMTPEQQAAAQNMQFLRERATRTPNRSAGATEPAAPSPRLSFEERLQSQLSKDGVI